MNNNMNIDAQITKLAENCGLMVRYDDDEIDILRNPSDLRTEILERELGRYEAWLWLRGFRHAQIVAAQAVRDNMQPFVDHE